MVFSELYSAYYDTVAKIIKAIIGGCADKAAIHKIIQENAFEESILNILPAIREERWQVITKDYQTPIKHVPSMPLTVLQKRWLKSILADERIKLFDVQIEGLDDVEPLFTKEDYRVYDKYSDGDNYQDEEYIARFKVILYALHNRLPVKAEMLNRRGEKVYAKFIPQRIEYSEKDDKFRVITGGCRYVATINLARLTKCSLYDGSCRLGHTRRNTVRSAVTITVKDERNALERTMLHFAHFEKQAEKIDDKNYKLIIKYDKDDEPEMVIRILSFGPLVEVVEPSEFRELIKEKLKKQQSCGLK
ncbi:MAG: WYL domain-containing protein [Candidatus Coproplasma sp.]